MTSNRLHTVISRRTLLRGLASGTAGLGLISVVGCGEGGSPKTGTTSATAGASPTSEATTAPMATQTVAAKAVWSPVAVGGAPGPRRDHSLTFNPDDGLIYLFGGRAKDISNDELWTFNPATGAWHRVSAAGNAPSPRFGHDAFYDAQRKRLVVTLGQGNGGAFFDDVWAYDAGGWSQLGAASSERPEVRYGAGAAYERGGDRVLISHGFTDRGRFDDTWSFDLAGNSWAKIQTSGAVPIKRCLTRCLSLPPERMLLFGGQTDSTPFLGDMWVLDLKAGAWSEKKPSPLPGPRNLFGAALDSRRMRWYVVSGNTPDGPSAETWAYDVGRDAWARFDAAGAPPPARYSADAAIAGERLYLFGGHDGTAELNDTWALDIAS